MSKVIVEQIILNEEKIIVYPFHTEETPTRTFVIEGCRNTYYDPTVEIKENDDVVFTSSIDGAFLLLKALQTVVDWVLEDPYLETVEQQEGYKGCQTVDLETMSIVEED